MIIGNVDAVDENPARVVNTEFSEIRKFIRNNTAD